mgnify:CR=1 FL=1
MNTQDPLDKLSRLIDRLEHLYFSPPDAVDWNASIAFRWRKQNGRGYLQPVAHPPK